LKLRTRRAEFSSEDVGDGRERVDESGSGHSDPAT